MLLHADGLILKHVLNLKKNNKYDLFCEQWQQQIFLNVRMWWWFVITKRFFGGEMFAICYVNGYNATPKPCLLLPRSNEGTVCTRTKKSTSLLNKRMILPWRYCMSPAEKACTNFPGRVARWGRKQAISRQSILLCINLFKQVSFWLPSSPPSQDFPSTFSSPTKQCSFNVSFYTRLSTVS